MKYLTIFISGLLFVCGLFGITLSVIKITKPISQILQNQRHPDFYLVEASDAILLSIVIFILSLSIYKFFVGTESPFSGSLVFYKLTNFKELKVMLWKVLLPTLTVWCTLDFYFSEKDKINNNKLILPGTKLLLAPALKLITSNSNS